jgi:hypothetical protein
MCSSRSATNSRSRGRTGVRAALAAGALLASVSLLAGPAPAWGRVPGQPPKTPTTSSPPPCLPSSTTCGVQPCVITVTAPCSPQTGTSPTGPTQTSGTQSDAGRENGLPALDAGDPFCGSGLAGQPQQNCRVSGSVAQPYPLSSYELDYENPPTGLSSLSPNDWFGTVLGTIVSVVWDAWLYAIRGVLDLLDWAFSLDLVNRAMVAVKNGLDSLHNDLFGSSWMLAALSIVGLWGIWNGLVRRKTIETLGGLAATVALMISATVLIAQPDATVGQFSADMNQASLVAVSAASRGSVDLHQPVQNFAQSESDLFNALVLRPWCALQFGDVSYCTAPRPGGMTVADMWLSFPAMGAGRQSLYNLATTGKIDQYGGFWGGLEKTVGLVSAPPVTTVAQACGSAPQGQQCRALKAATALTCWGQNHPSAACAFTSGQSSEVQMQSGGSALSRIALLAMISVGLLGAVLVLGYLGLKLLFAAIKVLLLTLAAPVMLFLPAFGESGRATFIAYAKRLFGALISKLVFAVMLALALLVGGIIATLPFGWFSVWMLTIVFWWGIFFERRALVGFLSLDKRATEGGLDVAGHGAPFRLVGAMIGGYYGARLLRDVARGVTALPRFARRRRLEGRMADSAALREGAGRELELRTRRGMELEDGDRLTRAKDTVAARAPRLAALRTERRGLQAELADKDRNLRRPNLQPDSRRTVEQQKQQLEAKLSAVDGNIDSAQSDIRDARSTITRFDGGARMPEHDHRDVERAMDQRRRDVIEGPFPTDDTAPQFERALYSAGIRPDNYRKADAARKQEYTRKAEIMWRRDRDLFGRVDSGRSGVPFSGPERRDLLYEADSLADPAARHATGSRGIPVARRTRVRAAEERERIRFERARARTMRGRR